MNLPQLTEKMGQTEFVKALIEGFRQIGSEDKKNRKTNSDVELASGQRLIMLGDDGVRYVVSIVGGVLTPTPL